MTPSDVPSLSDNDIVRRLVEETRRDTAGRIFSDIIDAEGRQYVDLVMEGGGVLGLALAGYTYLLEQVGIRFLRVGGTSAGSINALFLAALGPPGEPKSEQVAHELASLDMLSLLDGDEDVQAAMTSIVENRNWFSKTVAVLQVLDTVRDSLGLMPGERLRGWISGVLRRAGVSTWQDLRVRLESPPPGMCCRWGEPLPPADVSGDLAVVVTDVTTQTRVELPRMAPLYWSNPAELDPALFVRASVSIPFFFQPFVVNDIPNDEAAAERWKRLAGYVGPIPESCTLVDGGIVSNFPIDLFHQPGKVPLAPTFGVKLGNDRTRQVNRPLELIGAVFNSARNCLDYEFIIRNPDYRSLVAYIDTGPHHWLNFAAQLEDMRDLFLRGVEAARTFLLDFDWERYKRIRETLIASRMQSKTP